MKYKIILILTILFLIGLVSADVSYRYVKWEVVEKKGVEADCVGQSCIQASEFVLLLDNNTVSWPVGTTATNPGGANPDVEVPASAIDGNINTKWLDYNFNVVAGETTGNSNLSIDVGAGNTVLFNGYKWGTANDGPARDPISWVLYGSSDASTWVELDTKNSQTITDSRDTYTTNYQFQSSEAIGLDIVYPIKYAAYVNITNINYTINGSNPDSCWYSLNEGANSIPVVAGINFTNLNIDEGRYNLTVYCNDTSGNIGQDNLSFVVGDFNSAEQINKLLASDGAANDYFGKSVSISGDYAIVGAEYEDAKGSNSGSAYIFKKNSTGQFEQVNKITASDGAISDYFGWSVSISGDYAIVGAKGDDDNARSNSGSAYIFKKNSAGQFEQVNKITASDFSANDDFGSSVSISGDYAIVGSTHNYATHLSNGAAYIFKKNSTGQFEQVNKITASDGASNDYFGWSVSISGDYVSVGAYADDDKGDLSGSAYIFKKNSTGQFEQVNKITASDGAANDYFGKSVSISGDYAIAGAELEDAKGSNSGSAYIFKKNATGQFEQVNKITASDGVNADFFGSSVSISGDYASIGAYGVDSNAIGAAYIFKKNSTGQFEQVNKITASDGASLDFFGWSVSISGDYAIAGAYRDNDKGDLSGSTYIFNLTTDTTPPAFTNLVNQTAEYGITFNYQIDATDTSGVSCFTVNDTTNFKINCSGYLENNTILNEGLYVLNLSVNDTLNHISTTLMWVNVTDTISPQIDFTSSTPNNATTTANTSIELNVSITESNLDSVIYNWNETNFTMYNDSLVLMYNFDNVSSLGENSTYVVDVSNYSNNGTVNGSTWNPSGKYGGAFEFDGVDDYVTFNSIELSNESTTISWWMSPSQDSIDDGAYLFTNTLGTNSLVSHMLYNYNGNKIHLESKTNCNDVTWTANYNETGWHYWTIVFDGGLAYLYIDGISEGEADSYGHTACVDYETAYSVLNNLTLFVIGGRGTYAPRFNGTMDEVRMWDRSLSADEIYQQYVSNLKKINSDSWELYVNQSKNSSTGLNDGEYTYQAYAQDSSGNLNSSDLRTITIDNTPPQLSLTSPTPTNATSTTNTSIEINVSITEANLNEVKYNWNGTNFTMYNDSLILMYNFDNVSALGENDTYVVDISGSGNNGTTQGNANINITGGKYNGGLQLDGVGDYITIPDSPIFDTGSQITTSAWIKSNNSNQTAIGIVLHDNSDYKWLLYFTGGDGGDTVSFYIKTATGAKSAQCNNVEGAVANNQWHQLTGTYDQSLSSERIKMYYDGVECGIHDGYNEPISDGDEGVWIGKWSSRSFNGSMDEVRVWNETLSADEVYQQYVSNLKKIDSDSWELYVNQSKNTTAGLDDGNYTYQTYVIDAAGNVNQTEERIVTVNTTSPTITPAPAGNTGGSSSSGGGSSIWKPYECTENSDCDDDYSCYEHKCVKLFDVEIKIIDSLIDHLDFELEYLIKGMADINSDVIVEFWIEDNGEKIMLGKDTIYLGSFEEKIKTTQLNLPAELGDGSYDLYVQSGYGDYKAQSFRKVNIRIPEETRAKEQMAREEAGESTNILLWILIVLLILIVVLLLIRRTRIFIIGGFHYMKRKIYSPQMHISFQEAEDSEERQEDGELEETISQKEILARTVPLTRRKEPTKPSYDQKILRMGDLFEKKVFTTGGNYVGLIGKAIVSQKRVRGWVITPDKKYNLNKNIFIKHKHISDIKDVFLINEDIERHLFLREREPIRKKLDILGNKIKVKFARKKEDANSSQEFSDRNTDENKTEEFYS